MFNYEESHLRAAKDESYEYLFYYGANYYCLYCRDPKNEKYKVLEFDEPIFDGFYEEYPEYKPIKDYKFRFYLRDITGQILRYQFQNETYCDFRERLGLYIVDHADEFMYDKLDIKEFKESYDPTRQNYDYMGQNWDNTGYVYEFPTVKYSDGSREYAGTKEVEFDMIARLFDLKVIEDDERGGPVFM